MGYSTDFSGGLNIEPQLTDEQVSEINDFSSERHGGNVSHSGFPGFYCQWVITEYKVKKPDGEQTTVQILEWDGGEKFYDYIDWLKYLIKHFFSKWNVLLNGEITWEGEDHDDRGKIVVTNNVVDVYDIDEIIYKKR